MIVKGYGRHKFGGGIYEGWYGDNDADPRNDSTNMFEEILGGD